MDQLFNYQRLHKLDEIILSGNAVLVFSQELLDEFLDVARRSKFRRFFSLADVEELLETISEYADLVKVNTKVKVCRDPKDNFLLSLSIDSKADFLLTGDNDLLELAKIGETAIITISGFLQDK